MAKQFPEPGSSRMTNRVQEGYFGLRRAAELFDVPLDESGPPVRFSTYAGYWIRQAISRARLDQSGPVRVPLYMHLLVRQVGRQQVQVSDLPHRMRQCLRQAQRARGPGGEGQYVARPEDDTRELAETVKALLDTLEPTARTVITAALWPRRSAAANARGDRPGVGPAPGIDPAADQPDCTPGQGCDAGATGRDLGTGRSGRSHHETTLRRIDRRNSLRGSTSSMPWSISFMANGLYGTVCNPDLLLFAYGDHRRSTSRPAI
jgi:hypothetical protein